MWRVLLVILFGYFLGVLWPGPGQQVRGKLGL